MSLVVVDVVARNRLDEHLPAQDALYVIEHRRVPLDRTRLIRRVPPAGQSWNQIVQEITAFAGLFGPALLEMEV